MGELSSALAHELKQPLTAILSNAQAAQLLLARDDCDLQQIRDILGDIVADNKRAGEVIDRLHVLMKKGEFQPQPLEANQLIRDVLQLMNHELTGRSVRVVMELTRRCSSDPWRPRATSAGVDQSDSQRRGFHVASGRRMIALSPSGHAGWGATSFRYLLPTQATAFRQVTKKRSLSRITRPNTEGSDWDCH